MQISQKYGKLFLAYGSMILHYKNDQLYGLLNGEPLKTQSLNRPTKIIFLKVCDMLDAIFYACQSDIKFGMGKIS